MIAGDKREGQSLEVDTAEEAHLRIRLGWELVPTALEYLLMRVSSPAVIEH